MSHRLIQPKPYQEVFHSRKANFIALMSTQALIFGWLVWMALHPSSH